MSNFSLKEWNIQIYIYNMNSVFYQLYNLQDPMIIYNTKNNNICKTCNTRDAWDISTCTFCHSKDNCCSNCSTCYTCKMKSHNK